MSAHVEFTSVDEDGKTHPVLLNLRQVDYAEASMSTRHWTFVWIVGRKVPLLLDISYDDFAARLLWELYEIEDLR